MDILEKIIRENSWKFDKGYPDSQKDIDYLNQDTLYQTSNNFLL